MNKYIVAVAVLLAACGSPVGSRQAPAIVLPDPSGKIVSLESFRGKPVLVNFWATWCPSCREEMPALEDLFRRSGEKFSIIGVSLDDDPKTVPPFARKYGLTFPLPIADRKVALAYAVRDLPATYLIDADGRIVRRWVGALDVRAVENDILALLKRSPS
jgi:peroxiredoxin